MNSVSLRPGDCNPRVRELHERLRALGFVRRPEQGDLFDDVTVSLVEAFQRSRGLPLIGEVDETTWERLVEAGWKLGDRLLFLTKPYLRGDDVADMQVRLSQLGFDPGRIDGVFGPRVEEALTDFQNNCGIDVSGTLTRRTLSELLRVTPSVGDRTLVTELRDDVRGHGAPSGPLLLWGSSPLLSPLALNHTDSFFDESWQSRTVEEFAAHANALGARAVVAINENELVATISLHYWAGYQSHSRPGERLASGVAAALANSSIGRRLSVSGMALPILRETKMPTLVIEHPVLEADEGRTVTAVLAQALSDLVLSLP